VDLTQISVLILTYNEAPNIWRTLHALRAFPDILVLDSGSADETTEIVESFSNARIVTRQFDSHAAQWNYGTTQCRKPWVLALDADYVVPKELVDEIARLSPSPSIGGYRVAFRYCVFGRPLRAALYPPGIVLYRRDSTRYRQDGHTQRAVVDGTVEDLSARIDHDDRKPLSCWFTSQQRYAKLEAEHLMSAGSAELSRADRMRLLAGPAPFAALFYTLIIKRCLLDGWVGWFYAIQRMIAEAMIALEIADRRLRHIEPKKS
jgi:glycosyltransferase involved in cell wall biosynthesis